MYNKIIVIQLLLEVVPYNFGLGMLESIYRYEVIPELFEFPLGKNDRIFGSSTLRGKKYNRTTYVLDGGFEMLRPLDDKLIYHLSLDEYQGNEYRRFSYRTGDGLCTSTIKYRPPFIQYFEYTNLPADYTCPIVTGKYTINNLVIDDQLLFTEPKSEKLRVNYTFVEDGQVISVLIMYVQLNRRRAI